MSTTSAPHREQSAKRNKTADSSLNINQKQSTNIRQIIPQSSSIPTIRATSSTKKFCS
jgi:hypothetical protein